jgi:hypothetical protein
MYNSTSASRRRHTIKQMAMAVLLVVTATASEAVTNVATQAGPINHSATWGGATIPTSGDTDTWDTSGFDVTYGNETFYGGTLLVSANGNLDANATSRTLALQAATFDNGKIDTARDDQTLDFSNKALTIGSGGFVVDASNSGKTVNLNNGVWAGAGAINVFRGGPDGTAVATLKLQSGNNLAGYAGTITAGVTSPGDAVQLTIEAETSGTFGVVVGGVSTLSVTGATAYHFSALTLGADVIADGIVYELADFTPTQQGFLNASNWTGTISVGEIPDSATVFVVR